MGLNKARLVAATMPPEEPEVPEGLMAAPTSSNTKAEIQDFLDGEGVEYPSSATKSELLDLIP